MPCELALFCRLMMVVGLYCLTLWVVNLLLPVAVRLWVGFTGLVRVVSCITDVCTCVCCVLAYCCA